MKNIISIKTSVVLLSLLFVSVHAATSEDNSTYDKFRTAVANVSPWTEQSDKYQYFTVDDLYRLINGGAAQYQKQGLKNGISVSYSADNRSLQIYFDDFGLSSQAKKMVRAKKKLSSGAKKINNVNIRPVLYEEVIGGCIVYWAKGQYYVEMTFTGYNSVDNALSDAATLVNTISPIIEK